MSASGRAVSGGSVSVGHAAGLCSSLSAQSFARLGSSLSIGSSVVLGGSGAAVSVAASEGVRVDPQLSILARSELVTISRLARLSLACLSCVWADACRLTAGLPCDRLFASDLAYSPIHARLSVGVFTLQLRSLVEVVSPFGILRLWVAVFQHWSRSTLEAVVLRLLILASRSLCRSAALIPSVALTALSPGAAADAFAVAPYLSPPLAAQNLGSGRDLLHVDGVLNATTSSV